MNVEKNKEGKREKLESFTSFGSCSYCHRSIKGTGFSHGLALRDLGMKIRSHEVLCSKKPKAK